MVSVAVLRRLDAPSRSARTRLTGFLRRHRVFVTAFVLAAALRVITMLGYGPAMWFNDSYEYVSVALHPRPHPIRPDGYGFWLLLLKPLHSFTFVVFTQHLMGLAAATLIYVLLRRRFGLPGWGATLAAVPVLFDAYQIQLEQLIMSDSMFMLLVVAAVTLVLWSTGRRRRMSWRTGAAVGLLLAMAALTRSIGLPILALVLAYLLVKRAGWRPLLAVGTACAIPVVAYMAWFNSAYGTFAMTQSDGLILYMRTSIFADCNKMQPLEKDFIPICINELPEQRKQYSQWYLWGVGDGEVHHRYSLTKFNELKNEVAGEFAQRAILSQPGDYLAIVARDFFRTFSWGRPTFPDPSTFKQYEFTVEDNKPLPTWQLYKGRADTDAEEYEQGSPRTRVVSPWADIMQNYQRVVRLPGTLLGVILLIGLAGVLARWRSLGGTVLLPWLAAVGLILAPAATAEFDYRYLLPAVPLACIAAAISLGQGPSWLRVRPPRLRARRSRAPRPSPGGPQEPPAI